MARIVDFADGAQSETTPTIGSIVASKLVKYPDDASYEAAEANAPETGNIYYNTSDNTIRYYNGTMWQEILDETTIQALENKLIDADTNTISNIGNDEIKALAGIDATKIADGSVDNNEFQRLSGVTSPIQTQIDNKISTSEKGAANGVAELDGTGKVPALQLPSYVDDVEEYADFASLPVTGETGKIYITLDDNKQYRWSGSIYVELFSGSGGTGGGTQLVGGGNKAWDSGTGDFTFDSDIQVVVPGLSNTENNIPTTESPVNIPVGQVAYVTLNTTPSFAGIQQTSNIQANQSLETTRAVAQTFQAPSDFLLTSVEMLGVRSVSAVGNLNMYIYSTSGGAPDTLIATSTNALDASTFDTGINGGPETWNFNNVALTNGVTYAFVLDGPGQLSSGQVQLRGAGGASYGGGHVYDASTTAGPWTQRTSQDYAFVISGAGNADLTVSVDLPENVPDTATVILWRDGTNLWYSNISQVFPPVASNPIAPVWQKYTVSHADLQAAALTNDIELFSLPAKAAIHNVVIKHSVAFAGTGITAYDLSVGIASNLDKYSSAFDVFQAAGSSVGQATAAFDFEDFVSSTSIRVAATSVGANLDQSTDGSVDIYVLWGAME